MDLRAMKLKLNPRSLPFIDTPKDYQWDYADQEIKRYFSQSNQVIDGSELSLGIEFLAMLRQLKLRKVSNSFI